MQRSQFPADGAVGGPANDGRGKLILVPPLEAGASSLRLGCRDAALAPVSEQDLLDHIARVFASAGLHFPRPLLVNYYVSLKTNPFVVLAGQEGYGKAEFAATFAEAMLGRGSQQYALIPAASWTSATGEDGYYRGLLERFASLRFLDLLQDAAGPAGAGKAYLVCFNGLRPDEFSYYFTTLLQVDPAGNKRLKLPGVPADEWPVVPPNVSITATVNTAEYAGALNREVLRHAGLIHFRAPLRRASAHYEPAPPPPVGYQRLWLRAAVHDIPAARDRLAQILGGDAVARLRCSPELGRLLWRGGVVLTTRALQDLTTYIAASFDEHGRGLFEPSDPHINAQIAFDAQVAQRILWKLHDTADEELQRDLARYLDRLGPSGWQQAVA